MRTISGKELEAVHSFFKESAKVATQATCTRARCGSVIVNDKGEIIGSGYNSPPLDNEAGRTCDETFNHTKKPRYDITCCIHAEWRAILNALKESSQSTEGSTLYFMRIDENNNFTDAGVPFCTVCSRLAMEAGISYFALWNKSKADLYETLEYNKKSYDFHKL